MHIFRVFLLSSKNSSCIIGIWGKWELNVVFCRCLAFDVRALGKMGNVIRRKFSAFHFQLFELNEG